MTAAVLVNGISPANPLQALAVEDRGFHYGDGVFETALLTHGRVRWLEQHLRRLARVLATSTARSNSTPVRLVRRATCEFPPTT